METAGPRRMRVRRAAVHCAGGHLRFVSGYLRAAPSPPRLRRLRRTGLSAMNVDLSTHSVGNSTFLTVAATGARVRAAAIRRVAAPPPPRGGAEGSPESARDRRRPPRGRPAGAGRAPALAHHTDTEERVGDPARHVGECPGFGAKPLLAAHQVDRPGEHIEGLVLVAVDVQRCAVAGRDQGLDQTETATRLLRARLDPLASAHEHGSRPFHRAHTEILIDRAARGRPSDRAPPFAHLGSANALKLAPGSASKRRRGPPGGAPRVSPSTSNARRTRRPCLWQPGPPVSTRS
jgi:hypothetical protein